MSVARPSRAAAQGASARLSALFNGVDDDDDDDDAGSLDDEAEASSNGGTSSSDDEPAPTPTRPPPKKRARGGKCRAESRRQSRVRAEPSQLLPAQKMEKMRLWFERNEGIPPFRDTISGLCGYFRQRRVRSES